MSAEIRANGERSTVFPVFRHLHLENQQVMSVNPVSIGDLNWRWWISAHWRLVTITRSTDKLTSMTPDTGRCWSYTDLFRNETCVLCYAKPSIMAWWPPSNAREIDTIGLFVFHRYENRCCNLLCMYHVSDTSAVEYRSCTSCQTIQPFPREGTNNTFWKVFETRQCSVWPYCRHMSMNGTNKVCCEECKTTTEGFVVPPCLPEKCNRFVTALSHGKTQTSFIFYIGNRVRQVSVLSLLAINWSF